jgi:hypothetical protein
VEHRTVTDTETECDREPLLTIGVRWLCALLQFGIDPASKRCAKVDGLDKPWCYFGR